MSAVPDPRWPPEDFRPELRIPFENSPIGFAQCERQGQITALNPALERMLGITLSQTNPLLLTELIHPEDQADGHQLLRDLFDGKRESFQVDSLPTPAANQPLRWTTWRVPAANGDGEYALALVQNAPDHGVTEQRPRQAQRFETVGRLAGGIAHDFNNLLTGVLLYCDLLISSLEPGNRVRKYAEEIRNAGVQATGLVRQLLSAARSPNQQPRLLSLNEIVEGMRNLLRRLLGENIELKLQLDPNLGLVKMDPTQAQQILLNLVLNARDAMPRGGQITIETGNARIQLLPENGHAATSMPCAVFVVADAGSGMDAATRSHIFEAFFTTKGGRGTGLGLATVHDIVTGSGGLIHVDSAPSQGTRITVLLPLAPEMEPDFSQLNPLTNIEGALPANAKE